MKPRIRPVRLEDLDDLLNLARQTGFGLTTLPPERELLERRIQASLHAFQQQLQEPAGQCYLFVLELDGRAAGTSGILSKSGGFEPFYAYHIKKEHKESETLDVARDIEILELVTEHNGPAEIGSLFLDPACQSRGLGGLLSRSRFLFMAEHPKCFETVVVAELRGVVDDEGHSPFWDAVGKHFFGVDFHKADYLSVKSKKFIAELMPRHPLYVPLLPAEAQAVIGQVHPRTVPARRMLEREGFRFGGLVDIFEAGPVVACERDGIRTVRRSRRAEVAEIGPIENKGSTNCLVGNTRIDFRACLSLVSMLSGGGLRLDEETASALEVERGDAVRYVGKP